MRPGTSPDPYALLVELAAVVFVAVGTTACQSLSNWSWDADATTLPAVAPHPTELHARFFGTTTLLISDGNAAVMVDGFFSRPGLTQLGRVEPQPRRVEKALAFVDMPQVKFVLVAHSHHDHAMDAAIVAHAKHATVVGSESTRKIVLGSGLEVLFHPADTHERLEAGRFGITLFETTHSPYRFDDASLRVGIADAIRASIDHSLAGEIAQPVIPPTSFTSYKVGTSYAFFIDHPQGRILVVPSANVPLHLGDTKADVVFLSVADADKLSNARIRAYWREAVEHTEAKLVVPVHWDRFWRSLDSPLRPLPSIFDDVDCAMETFVFLNADARAIRRMPLFAPVDLRADSLAILPHGPSPGADPFTDGCRKGRDDAARPTR